MTINSRSKGRRGQQQARLLLESLDWRCAELNSGTAVEDFIVVDPQGKSYSCEVKNTVAITLDHWKQAQRQAKARRLPAMLMAHIPDSSSWLIRRTAMRPVVWHMEKDE